MDLSIIIVNYNSAHHVLNCVESIYKETTEHSFEIIVVDNQSTDNSQEIILSKYKEIIWLQMGYNAGFARANNLGIQNAKGSYVLLLNADTIVLDNALDKTLDLLMQNPEIVGCGVQLLNADGTHQLSGAQFVKGGLNILLALPYLGRIIRYFAYKLNTKVPNITQVEGKIYVDWIVGAFLLVRKNVFPKTGLLDEDFFMYSEEIEWCYRLKKEGALCLFSEPKVIHLLGGTSNVFYNTTDKENYKNIWSKKGRQIMLSNLVRVRKQYGIMWFFVHFLFYIIEIPVFFCGLLFSSVLSHGKSFYHWNNLKEFTINVIIVTKYFFRIIYNKPFFYKLK